MAALKRAGKNGYGEKQTVKVVTVDKERRRVECAMRDGAMIWAAVWETGTVFRWPEVGEVWTVRQDTGVWRLDKIVQSPLSEEESEATSTSLADLAEGDTRILGNNVYVNTLVAESVISKTEDLFVNVKVHGAKGDGTTDDTESVEKAIGSLGANGGTIFFPYGIYKLSSQLNFDKTRSVRLVGIGGLSGGAPVATQLLFSQGGTESLISAQSSAGFGMADLNVIHSNASFVGPELDLTHNGVGGSDSAYFVIERCNFNSLGGLRTAYGIDLNKAIIGRIHDCRFGGLDIGVRGQNEPGSYSNEISFDGCSFIALETCGLKNPGESWNVRGCTFESLSSGAAGAILHDPSVFGKTLNVQGCWMGDVSGSAESKWIDYFGSGLIVTGNLFGGNNGSGANVVAIKVIDKLSEGLTVTSNRFDSVTTGVMLGTETKRYIIGANAFNNVTKKVSLDAGATDSGAGFLSN